MQVLDEVSNGLRKGRYPDKDFGSTVAQALRKARRPARGLTPWPHPSRRSGAPRRTRCSPPPSTSPGPPSRRSPSPARSVPTLAWRCSRSASHALVRVHVAGIPGVAWGRSGGPCPAGQGGHGLRDQPPPRTRGGPRARVAALCRPARARRPRCGRRAAATARRPLPRGRLRGDGRRGRRPDGLLRARPGPTAVLSPEGREAAATRWYAGDSGPSRRSRSRRRRAARRAATSCRWPARCGPSSASAPTSGARPTGASSRSTTGAVPTRRPTSSSPSRRPSVSRSSTSSPSTSSRSFRPTTMRHPPKTRPEVEVAGEPAPGSVQEAEAAGAEAEEGVRGGGRPRPRPASGTEPSGIRPRSCRVQAASLALPRPRRR